MRSLRTPLAIGALSLAAFFGGRFSSSGDKVSARRQLSEQEAAIRMIQEKLGREAERFQFSEHAATESGTSSRTTLPSKATTTILTTTVDELPVDIAVSSVQEADASVSGGGAVDRLPPTKPISSDSRIERHVDEETGIVTLLVPVSASHDDAEEYGEGKMYLNSTDLEFIWDEIEQLVGLRFAQVPVPQGAEVLNAYIQFECDESDVGPTLLMIHGEAVDHAPAFQQQDENISRRDRTKKYVSWRPVEWLECDRGPAQKTPDLSSIVQEIIARPGWASGNACAFVFTGTGKRCAVAYDGERTSAPQLVLQFKLPETRTSKAETQNTSAPDVK